LGQKIQTDCTSNALTIHIAKDKSTDITTISSALHKRMKTSVPVAESIPGDDDRPLTPMDVDEEGTDVLLLLQIGRRLFCSNNNGTDDFL
jgi:hypothetical protein